MDTKEKLRGLFLPMPVIFIDLCNIDYRKSQVNALFLNGTLCIFFPTQHTCVCVPFNLEPRQPGLGAVICDMML